MTLCFLFPFDALDTAAPSEDGFFVPLSSSSIFDGLCCSCGMPAISPPCAILHYDSCGASEPCRHPLLTARPSLVAALRFAAQAWLRSLGLPAMKPVLLRIGKLTPAIRGQCRVSGVNLIQNHGHRGYRLMTFIPSVVVYFSWKRQCYIREPMQCQFQGKEQKERLPTVSGACPASSLCSAGATITRTAPL